METKNPIQVSERIFAVIESLAAHGAMGLQELSTLLSLNKSTVHRILMSLICLGYVRQDTNSLKYSLSFKFCNLATQILSQNNMIDFVHPFLKELSEFSGETVHLVELDDLNAVYIDKVEATSNSMRLVSRVGKTIPLYCSGVGKAMMAEMSDQEIQTIWNRSEIIKFTPYTITIYEELLHRISEVRQKGYALDNEENEIGVRCLAACLHSYDKTPTYAISISAPKERMDDTRISALADKLLKIKQQIAKKMGVTEA